MKKTFSSFFLCALVALSILACVRAEGETATDMSSTFEGAWNLKVTSTGPEQQFSSVFVASVQELVLNLTRTNGQLVGAITSSDGEIDLRVTMATSGVSAGNIYLLGGASSEEEFDSGHNLMAFDFTESSGRTRVSSGIWNGASGLAQKTGHYQATLTDASLLVLNIWSESSLVTVTGVKVLIQPQTSFFSQYGTPIMFVAFFIISRVIRSYASPKEDHTEVPQAQPKATAAAKPKAD